MNFAKFLRTSFCSTLGRLQVGFVVLIVVETIERPLFWSSFCVNLYAWKLKYTMTGAYSEPSQTSKTELFAKVVKGCVKSFSLDA